MDKKIDPKHIAIITLGCAKNLVDSEILHRQLAANGFHVNHQGKVQKHGIVVINTCGFINDAKQESIDTILQYAEARKRGDISGLFVTGCLSQRYREELQQEIGEVDGYFGVDSLRDILLRLKSIYRPELEDARVLSTPSHYAYVKIAEGCNRKCSFCSIPMIRGKHHSRPAERIVSEVKSLVDQGLREAILISQDLSSYGMDLSGKSRLAELVEKLAAIKNLNWLRLHYLYPSEVIREIIPVIRSHENICNYIDMPIQHISDRILRSMRRGHDSRFLRDLIGEIRTGLPDAALRTTLIVGYPGESDSEFGELADLVEEVGFERLGVFLYSHEEGTAASGQRDNVPDKVRQERMEYLMEIQQQIALRNNEDLTGRTLKVLIDREEPEFYVGRTEYDSPEIDNEVLVKKNQTLREGSFYKIKIMHADFFDLTGETPEA